MTIDLRKLWAVVKQFAGDRLGIRTGDDVRAHLFIIVPYIMSALVAWNAVDADKAKLIAAFALAVVSPAFAFINTQDGFRRWVYGLLPALQALLVGLGVATDNQITPIMAAVVAFLGGGLAAINTNISHGPNDSRKTSA